MNLQEFRRILRATLLLPLILLLVLATILAWQIQRTLGEQRSIDHSDRITVKLNDAQRLIVDQDGSLHNNPALAHEAAMPGAYMTSANQLQTVWQGLAKLVKNDPEQAWRLRQIRDSHEIWLGYFSQIPAGLKAGALGEGKTFNRDEKQALNGMLAQLRDMMQIEATRRHEEVGAARFRVRMLMTVLLVSSVGVGFLLGIFTQRNLRKVSHAYSNSLDEVNQHADELFQSRQWLQTTLESVADALITCDSYGQVEFMNPVAQRLTGWKIAEGQGRSLSEVFHVVDQESRQPVEDPGKQALGKNAIHISPSRSVLVARNRSEREIDYSAAPIRGAVGEPTGVVLVFRDVTERRQAETALLASEKLAVAGRLTASIAHEIHNPLDAVANLHYLMERESDPAQQLRYLAMAQLELNRTLQISRAMLSLYRESKAPLQVNLCELLESVLLLLDRRLKDQSITLERNLDAAATIEGFPGELRQVFTNLITNAAEAAGPRGRIHVRLERTPPGHSLPGAVVVITDNGKGIPEGMEAKLGQPFFTTKGEHGTGLGLWVSRGIVEKHGGTMELANSNEGELRGALVRVSLPAHVASAIQQSALEPASRASSGSSDCENVIAR